MNHQTSDKHQQDLLQQTIKAQLDKETEALSSHSCARLDQIRRVSLAEHQQPSIQIQGMPSHVAQELGAALSGLKQHWIRYSFSGLALTTVTIIALTLVPVGNPSSGDHSFAAGSPSKTEEIKLINMHATDQHIHELKDQKVYQPSEETTKATPNQPINKVPDTEGPTQQGIDLYDWLSINYG